MEGDRLSATASNATQIHWQRFEVPYQYPVAFTRGLFKAENTVLLEALRMRETDKRHKCLVFVDSGFVAAAPQAMDELKAYFEAHSSAMELAAEPVALPGGERVKIEPEHLETMQDAIHAHKIDRHSYVIAIGGGAVVDAVGLAATIAHRGCRHIRIPTTVLAQNDAAIGVKNAVNFKGLKNYLGSFAPPWAVLNDFDFVERLTPRDRIAGVSEAVKVGLIRDGAFYLWLEENAAALAKFDRAPEEYMIRRCAELHMRQIAHGGDPFETGSARPLDFGHWAGHKLESLTNHEVLHGEGVAIGIALDSRYSVLAGLLEPGKDVRIAKTLETMGFNLWHDALAQKGADGRMAVLAGLEEFQEHLGGELTITLLKDLGVGHEVHEMDHAKVAEAAAWLANRGWA